MNFERRIMSDVNTSKKKDGKGLDFSWIFETVFGSVQSLVGKLFDGVAVGVEDILSRIARRGLVLVLAIFGMWFLLFGFARLLDFLYGVPGVGQVLVGTLVFSTAVILSALWKRER